MMARRSRENACRTFQRIREVGANGFRLTAFALCEYNSILRDCMHFGLCVRAGEEFPPVSQDAAAVCADPIGN